MSEGAQLPRKVDYEDVDDIIGIAAEMSDADAERLSVEELREVATDLAIPVEYVEPAITELRKRRALTLAEDDKARKRRKTWFIASGVVLALVAVWAIAAQASLRSQWGEVEQKRAQVVNVLERQAATEKQWRGRPASPDRDAELSGAENRVRIERKRYDEVAAAYNSSASGFPNGLWRAMFDLPDRAPLSNEITQW